MVQPLVSTLELIGGPFEVEIGETWRVGVTFNYLVLREVTIVLKASPFTRITGILNRVDSLSAQVEVTLPPVTELTPVEMTIEMPFFGSSDGGIRDGTYGLIVEILGTGADAKEDNAIIVSGNPPGLLSLIPSLVTVMIMGMMMNMMGGLTGE